MGIIDTKNVCGYQFGTEIVCIKCLIAKDILNILENFNYTDDTTKIITAKIIKDDDNERIYFCDRCGELI